MSRTRDSRIPRIPVLVWADGWKFYRTDRICDPDDHIEFELIVPVKNKAWTKTVDLVRFDSWLQPNRMPYLPFSASSERPIGRPTKALRYAIPVSIYRTRQRLAEFAAAFGLYDEYLRTGLINSWAAAKLLEPHEDMYRSFGRSPPTKTIDDSAFALLGEPSPVFWKYPELVEWLRDTGELDRVLTYDDGGSLDA